MNLTTELSELPRVRTIGRRRPRWWSHPSVFAGAILVLITVLAPVLSPYDPVDLSVGPSLSPPSTAHPMGTDQFGRDVLSRVISGTRLSLVVGLAATSLAMATGSVLGATAGWAGRLVSVGIMRLLDVMMAFPGILLAVVLAASFGAGPITAVIVLAIIYVAPFARFVRAAVAKELAEDYVVSSRVLGSSPIRILGYHVAVNVAFPLVVFAMTVTAEVIIIEAALSFIGVGIPPPTPSWGNVIADGRAFIYGGQWWVSTFGGLAVFLTVYTFQALANHLSRIIESGELR